MMKWELFRTNDSGIVKKERLTMELLFCILPIQSLKIHSKFFSVSFQDYLQLARTSTWTNQSICLQWKKSEWKRIKWTFLDSFAISVLLKSISISASGSVIVRRYKKANEMNCKERSNRSLMSERCKERNIKRLAAPTSFLILRCRLSTSTLGMKLVIDRS